MFMFSFPTCSYLLTTLKLHIAIMGEASISPVYTEDPTLNRKQNFKLSFTDITLQTCRRTQSLLDKDTQVFLDGQSLDLGAVVAVARSDNPSRIDPAP